MKIPDIINGGFELFGSVAVWLNVAKLARDKQIRGLHWQLSFFFTSWGIWNLYYYLHLSQYFSWACCVSLAMANIVWLAQAIYYAAMNGCAGRCGKADEMTAGRYYCTRDAGHEGPCAAVPRKAMR